MAKRPREFVDNDHQVMGAYYDLCENYAGRSAKTVKSFTTFVSLISPGMYRVKLKGGISE